MGARKKKTDTMPFNTHMKKTPSQKPNSRSTASVSKHSTKPVIRWLIFDLGGVIMHGGYLDFIHHYCLQCMTQSGQKKIAMLEHQVNLGTITETDFYKQIRKSFGVSMAPAGMRRIIMEKMQPDLKLLHILPTLRPAHLALFTNSIGFMAKDVLRQRKIPTKQLFDAMYFSNIMHVAKPDSVGYRTVLEDLHAAAKQTLMIDDRVENIRAARKIGMHGIVYHDAEQFLRAIRNYALRAPRLSVKNG